MRTTLYYSVEARDRYGKLLKREKRKSRSYVQQWNELVCVQAGRKTSFSIKDIDGVDQAVNYDEGNFYMTGQLNVTNWGIVVGTGVTAVTISDYALAALCANGTGENQLLYLEGTVADAAVVGSDCSFTNTRIALNNSGATITVGEIGVHVVGTTNGSDYFLVIRDVLASSIEVPDGGAITVVYTIKVTV